MSIPVFLAVSGWRTIRVWWPFALIGAFVLAVALIIVEAVKRDGFELDLLATGACTAKTEQLFTPPPTSQCVSRSKDGACLQTVYIPQAPYMRTLVGCPGHEDFWRRSSSIPYGSFPE